MKTCKRCGVGTKRVVSFSKNKCEKYVECPKCHEIYNKILVSNYELKNKGALF